MDDSGVIKTNEIERRIILIRNCQVMIDRDLADLYGVETRRLNEQVKRNKERFPEHFMFQLTKEEQENYETFRDNILTIDKNSDPLISQIATSNKGGNRKPSYAFTEQGVAMLASVLHSDTAIKMSIRIIEAFVAMRRYLMNNAKIFMDIESIKKHQIDSDLHILNNEKKIDDVMKLMEKNNTEVSQGIFSEGQIFDAYVFVIDLIRKAKSSIVLIDNYIDETVFIMLDRREEGVSATVYTANFPNRLKLDLEKHNSQYQPIKVEVYNKSHDRFLIIDDDIYLIGASLKDMGKKMFGFSKLHFSKEEILNRL